MDILEEMLKRAQANPQRIVLPEGDEPRTLEAANLILRDKIARLILIGNPETIRRIIVREDMDPNKTYYLKFKNVLDDDIVTTQFFMDYLEICAKEVYDNPMTPEDIW